MQTVPQGSQMSPYTLWRQYDNFKLLRLLFRRLFTELLSILFTNCIFHTNTGPQWADLSPLKVDQNTFVNRTKIRERTEMVAFYYFLSYSTLSYTYNTIISSLHLTMWILVRGICVFM